jgi:hypothetical protein
MRRSVLLCLAVVAIQASAAIAQPTQPWTGIAANEARANNGQQFGYGDNYMWGRTMSDDGRFVVFDSSLSHLVYGDTNNWNDVFLRDRQTGELTRVSVASDGSQGNHYSAAGTISRNGRHIAFYSCATNFDAADTNNSCDLFIHDRVNGTTVRANLGPNGEQATNTAQHQFNLSADGRYLAFNAGFNADRRVWLRDRDTDEDGVFDEPGTAATTLISQDVVGSESLRSFENAAISGDGRWIAYVANVGDGNTNEIGARMFLHDRVGMNTSRVDRPMANGTETYAYASGPDFSDAGLLVYASNENNLAEGDTDGLDDIYVFNVFTGGNVPIELTHPGAPALEYEWAPAISADGRYVTFMGVTVGEWSNYLANVYVVDRQTGQSYEISVRPDGSRDDHASAPAISADGLSIAFSAGAEMLQWGWGNTGVFVATNVALSPSEIDVPGDGGTFTIDLTVPDGIAWTLNTLGAAGIDFSATSGVGPATIDATVYASQAVESQDFYVLMGTEQVILHQTVNPRVYGVWPYEGGLEGGTSVQIYGDAFAEGATVTIGGVPATDVIWIDSHMLSATTPAHSGIGWVEVAVTNPDGASGTIAEGFRYGDFTPPVVTYQIAGTPGQNGWYIGDVTVTWTYEDPESTVDVIYCFNPYTQATEGSQFAICYVTSEGGETIVDVEVKKDTMPPIIALAPAYPETYAQGQQVPIALYCSDETSGVPPVNCTMNQCGPNLDTSTVGTFVLSATAIDMAGHTTTTSTSYTVKMVTGLTVPVATGVYGNASALLRATLSGPVSPLAGRTITFFVDNVAVGTAVTAANGEAILSFPLNGRNADSYEMHAEFAGDDTAFASMAPGALMVNRATPVVTWANPSPIVTTTPLGSTQLNATASVAGSFAYQPGFWAVLPAGTHTLSVQFTPQDSANYEAVTKTVTVKVKAIPVITWTPPAAITYPAFLGATQLNATANVAGTFVYNPPAGTLLDAGSHTIYVEFTPSNTADYVSESSTTTIEVLKGTVTINWPPYINPFFYGSPLTGLQLNAEVSASGSLTYSPPYGTILNAGTQTLTVTYTSNSPGNYHPATATQQLLVRKAYPVVYWQGDLAPIVYGTPLGPAQLYATSPNAGTITYDPPAGTLLDAAETPRIISMTFTPDDTANYNTVTYQKTIAVVKQTTTVTWNTPAPIVYGTALGAAQLNATGSQPGTFTYNPPAGTVLNAGTHTLQVYFTPTSSNYYGGSWTTTLVVAKRTPVITWGNPAPIVYGTALGSTQLHPTVDVGGGGFQFDPPFGAVLNAGLGQTLTTTYTPSSSNYNSVSTSVTIDVLKATPYVTWVPVTGITYGTPLGAAQLNAAADRPGTFGYTPGAGTVLPAGVNAVSTTFTPDDSENYAGVTLNRQVTVLRATPVLAWQTPAAITYGTPLSSTQLNATSSTPGSFEYTTVPGAVLNAGTHTLNANFMANDQANYLPGPSIQVSLEVVAATPVVTWPSPASIVYGTALSGTQLNATANAPGSFAYSPAAGTVLSAGTHSLTVTFTSSSGNYTGASSTVDIVVGKVTPVITWANPAGITYGTALSATQLNASANVTGTFAYSPAAGSVLDAGPQALSLTFTPTDSSNYNAATAGVSIVVGKATPVVTWSNPAGITYGTALSATQLNATANVSGSFAYSPAAGTVLGAGTPSLSVTFTPTDAANYTSASAGASIVIATKALTVQANDASKVYGAALPAFTASGTGFVNGDSMASLGGTLSFATSATATSAPGTYAVTPSGATSANYTITFAAGTLTVTKASTSLALTTTPNPSNNNQSVQLRAEVSAVAPGAGTATGTVEFRENGTLLGTATLVNGIATMNKNFKRGTHPLTATYAGNTSFNGSSGSVTHQTQ